MNMGPAYLNQLIPVINEPERETDQTSSATAEIKNAWDFISTVFFQPSRRVL